MNSNGKKPKYIDQIYDEKVCVEQVSKWRYDALFWILYMFSQDLSYSPFFPCWLVDFVGCVLYAWLQLLKHTVARLCLFLTVKL